MGLFDILAHFAAGPIVGGGNALWNTIRGRPTFSTDPKDIATNAAIGASITAAFLGGQAALGASGSAAGAGASGSMAMPESVQATLNYLPNMSVPLSAIPKSSPSFLSKLGTNSANQVASTLLNKIFAPQPPPPFEAPSMPRPQAVAMGGQPGYRVQAPQQESLYNDPILRAYLRM
jgi:hypothetical protein